MSKTVATVDISNQVWFNKHDAAEYMRRLGFRDTTPNTIMHAHRIGKLQNGEPKGKAFHWHKDSLDDYANRA